MDGRDLTSHEIDTMLQLDAMADEVYRDNVDMGWYTDPETGLRKERNVGELIALVHSELSEAFEGYRKDLDDDHLPMFKSIEVELADVIIRVFDLVGYKGLRLGAAYVAKRRYNATRADHKLENRKLEHGKKF